MVTGLERDIEIEAMMAELAAVPPLDVEPAKRRSPDFPRLPADRCHRGQCCASSTPDAATR
jgi:hypothetical protein